MYRSARLRIGLGVLLLAGVTVIAWNFVSRRQAALAPRSQKLLSPDLSRTLTKPVYWERKDGRVSFRVRADLSVESAQGVIKLDNVALDHYDANGELSDMVSAEHAVYETADKHIEFLDEVRLRLADGTEVYSDTVRTDLSQELVLIEQAFRFKRGDASGQGQSLLYRIPSKQLEIHGRFELTIPGGDSPLQVNADHAFYDLIRQTVQLEGSARLGQGESLMTAAAIDVVMTPQSRIERLLGSGQACIAIEGGRSVKGEEIRLFFEPETKRMTGFTVLAGPTDPSGAARRAVYEEMVQQGIHHLEADQIDGRTSPSQASNRVTLQDFTAVGKVALKSAPMGIEDSRADRLQGWFYEGGRDLRRLEMTGSVSVFRKTADRKKKPLEQKLSSEVLSLDFLPGQQLQEAIANRRVVVNLEEAQEKRSLAAQESLRVWYRDGLVDRMEGVGGCVVQGVSEDGDSRAEAPVFRAWYEEGKLKRLNAEGGVVVHTEEKAVKRTTTSRQMEASYQAGKLSELLHTGDLRFREEGPTSQLDLTGDQARYSAQDERVTVSGKATPVLRYRGQAKGKSEWQTSETRAATFVLNRRDKHIVAEGAVRSVLQEKDGLIVVNAQKMEADQGGSWVTYTGDPKVTQNANSIAGQSVRYNNDDQQLVVDGQVVSVLVGEGRSVLRKYRVLSSHLVYDRKKGNALYEGEVEVTSQDFRLLAPFVQLEFETDQTRQMRQVAAWGGVQVWQLERKAQGKRAIYDPKSERVELFSN